MMYDNQCRHKSAELCSRVRAIDNAADSKVRCVEIGNMLNGKKVKVIKLPAGLVSVNLQITLRHVFWGRRAPSEVSDLISQGSIFHLSFGLLTFKWGLAEALCVTGPCMD